MPCLTHSLTRYDDYSMPCPTDHAQWRTHMVYQAWMEKYLPTAENVVQKNSTATCNEWVKLCIDDGSKPFVCSGPQGNIQLHSVGAYLRDSGTSSMEDLEEHFTAALGEMKVRRPIHPGVTCSAPAIDAEFACWRRQVYDPFMALHAAFYTTELDTYITTFEQASVPTFASSFIQGGTTYYSLAVQVDGSLRAGVGSMLVLLLIGPSATLSSRAGLHRHPVPQASPTALHRAKEAAEARPPRSASAVRRLDGTSSPPPLTMLHVSWPSSNVTVRDDERASNPWAYVRHACGMRAACVRLACDMRAAYMRYTCGMHAVYVRHACCIRAACMRHACGAHDVR